METLNNWNDGIYVDILVTDRLARPGEGGFRLASAHADGMYCETEILVRSDEPDLWL